MDLKNGYNGQGIREWRIRGISEDIIYIYIYREREREREKEE